MEADVLRGRKLSGDRGAYSWYQPVLSEGEEDPASASSALDLQRRVCTSKQGYDGEAASFQRGR